RVVDVADQPDPDGWVDDADGCIDRVTVGRPDHRTVPPGLQPVAGDLEVEISTTVDGALQGRLTQRDGDRRIHRRSGDEVAPPAQGVVDHLRRLCLLLRLFLVADRARGPWLRPAQQQPGQDTRAL